MHGMGGDVAVISGLPTRSMAGNNDFDNFVGNDRFETFSFNSLSTMNTKSQWERGEPRPRLQKHTACATQASSRYRPATAHLLSTLLGPLEELHLRGV